MNLGHGAVDAPFAAHLSPVENESPLLHRELHSRIPLDCRVARGPRVAAMTCACPAAPALCSIISILTELSEKAIAMAHLRVSRISGDVSPACARAWPCASVSDRPCGAGS